MSSEVFRFVSVRPPARIQGSSDDTVILLEYRGSQLAQALRDAWAPGAALTMIAMARRFASSDEFVGPRGGLDRAYGAFSDAVHSLPAPEFASAANKAVQRIFATTPGDLVTTDAFKRAVMRVADSLLAVTVDDDAKATARTWLVRLARALWLVRRLADGATPSWGVFSAGRLVLPAGILPLPGPVVKPRDPAGPGRDRRRQLDRLSSDLPRAEAQRMSCCARWNVQAPSPPPSPRAGAPPDSPCLRRRPPH